jgi:hypothetical protein
MLANSASRAARRAPADLREHLCISFSVASVCPQLLDLCPSEAILCSWGWGPSRRASSECSSQRNDSGGRQRSGDHDPSSMDPLPTGRCSRTNTDLAISSALCSSVLIVLRSRFLLEQIAQVFFQPFGPGSVDLRR